MWGRTMCDKKKCIQIDCEKNAGSQGIQHYIRRTLAKY